MAPLSDLHNQARPPRRPAVYGRRLAINAETREIHRQLFGTDENEVENGLRGLTIDADRPQMSECQPQRQAKTDTYSPPKSETKGRRAATRPPKTEPTTDPRPDITAQPTTQLEETPHRFSSPVRDPKAGQKSRITEMAESRVRRHRPAKKADRTDAAEQTTCTRPRPRRQPTRRKKEPKMAALTKTEKERLDVLLPFIKSKTAVLDFGEYISSQTKERDVVKVGEGSFSEVFRFTEKEAPFDSSVFKIIPFDIGNDDHLTNSKLDDVAREVNILDRLAEQHGFTALRSFQIVRGRWPQLLIDAFDIFSQTHLQWAENERPTDQEGSRLYGVIEMENAGSHLEDLKHPSSYQVHDVFWKTAIYLARAEKDLDFEHRDLHMSNICFKSDAIAASGTYQDSDPVLGRSGLQITIIDYTLARMRSDGVVMFHPSGVGNGSINNNGAGSHQTWAIERARRWCSEEAARLLAEGKVEEGVGDKWSLFLPKSNVIWLGHLLWELLGRGVEVKEAATEADEALQRDVWSRLKDVLGNIEAESLAGVPESAEALVTLGLERGWVAKADLEAFVEQLNSVSA